MSRKNKTKKQLIKELSDLRRQLKELESMHPTPGQKLKPYSENEYDKLKTEFFSNISHELKTPLSVIFAALQLLKLTLKNKHVSSESIDKYLSIMRQNSYRLLRMVNNIIDITKIDANFFNLNLQNSDIVDIIRGITLSAEDYVKSKGISLQFISNSNKKIIAFDTEKIERIMLNLLSNAVKFTQPGGSITVNIYDNGDTVRITVRDTGIGIPEDKLSIIFERFMQVDKSLTRSHEGSGIGLSIVKSLVELHSGKIYAVSDYGKGSEFIVELPATVLNVNPGIETVNSSIEQHVKEKINIEFSDIG